MSTPTVSIPLFDFKDRRMLLMSISYYQEIYVELLKSSLDEDDPDFLKIYEEHLFILENIIEQKKSIYREHY